MKSMDDKEIQDTAFARMMGDLDHIEADGMFNEHESQDNLSGDHKGIKVEANGMSIHVKPMDGQQSQDMPKFTEKKEEEEGEFDK